MKRCDVNRSTHTCAALCKQGCLTKQNTHRHKQSVELSLLVPRSEALALPYLAEQATNRATPVWIHLSPVTNLLLTAGYNYDCQHSRKGDVNNSHPVTSNVAWFRLNMKLARFQSVKNQAHVNASNMSIRDLALPSLNVRANLCSNGRDSFPGLVSLPNSSALPVALGA